jgi:hypothetical protein
LNVLCSCAEANPDENVLSQSNVAMKDSCFMAFPS